MKRRKRMLNGLDQEIRDHIEREVEENLERGMSPEEARRAALRKFGNVERVKEDIREVWTAVWLEQFLPDFRFGLRTLRKSPGFAAVAILTLALGIGANTAIFSVIDAVLLKSLPYPDSSRLVLVWGIEREENNHRGQVSATDVADWRKQNHVFEDIATYSNWQPTLTGLGQPRRIPAMLVGDGYFAIMRAHPLLGRTFLPEENIDGKDNEIILSYSFWQRDMGGDPNVVGRSLVLNGRSHTIVGVLPSSFRSLPLSLLMGPPALIYRPVGENYDNKMRSARHLRAIARLKKGLTLSQAQVEMRLIGKRLEKRHPTANWDYGVNVVQMKEDLVGELRPALLTLFAAVGLVLLIACANVANLLLARSPLRQREVALRAALGAGPGRLLRQFLTESLILSFAGGGAGILLAALGTPWILRLGRMVFPALNGAGLNLVALGFTLAIAMLTSLLFGIAPARRAIRLNLTGALNEGRRGLVSKGRLRDVLVVSETALALVVVVGAGLMIHSVLRLFDLNPGFSPDHSLTMNLSSPFARYPKATDRIAFYRELVDKMEALPGVETAGSTSVLPLGGNFDGRSIQIFDHPRPRGQEYSVDYYAVTPGYFRAMKIPLKEGRFFTDDDRESSAPVVIIDETLARTIWPSEDPIGKRIRAPGQLPLEQEPWSTVIGVVGDVKQWALDRPGTMQLYGPEWQVGFGWQTLVVRTEKNPKAMSSAVRRVINLVDPDEAVSGVQTMAQIVSDSIALRRLAMELLSVLACLALVLALVGIYGVISFSVAQRTAEFGLRLALGAQPREVLGLVLGYGARLTSMGIVTGVAVSLASTRLMHSLLFGVGEYDPPTFCLVAVLVLTVALLASYLPARRAMHVDPITALRHE